MNLGVIYCLTSPSGKMYIGQTWDYEKRWNTYKKLYCKDQPKLYNALKKYGPNSFKYEIIDYYDNQTEANNKEIWYIENYDSIKNGCNVGTGGEGGNNFTNHPNKEVIREKQRVAKIGKKMSKEFCLQNKLRQIGRIISKETLDKRSKALKGRDISKEWREKLSNANCKNIYKLISPNGETFTVNNLRKFCKENNLLNAGFWQLLRNKPRQKSYKGWNIEIMPHPSSPSTQ